MEWKCLHVARPVPMAGSRQGLQCRVDARCFRWLGYWSQLWLTPIGLARLFGGGANTWLTFIFPVVFCEPAPPPPSPSTTASCLSLYGVCIMHLLFGVSLRGLAVLRPSRT